MNRVEIKVECHLFVLQEKKMGNFCKSCTHGVLVRLVHYCNKKGAF